MNLEKILSFVATAVFFSDGKSWNVLNGSRDDDGSDGASCIAKSIKEGIEISCGEGDYATTVTLYKAMSGSSAYDPTTHFCFDDEIYEKCGGSVRCLRD